MKHNPDSDHEFGFWASAVILVAFAWFAFFYVRSLRINHPLPPVQMVVQGN